MSARRDILAAMPGTAREIQARTGFTKSLIRSELTALHSGGESHIKSWQRTQGSTASVHAAGPGCDAPKVEAVSDVERHRLTRVAARSGVKAMDCGMLPAALMAQSRVFPLAGVWA